MDDLSPNVTEAAAHRRLADWLIRKGRFRTETRHLLAGFGRRANDYGIPLWRAHYLVQTLHPLNRMAVVRWHDDGEGDGELHVPHGLETQSRFRDSPIKRVFEGAGEIRRRLEGDGVVLDYPILPDLREQGATDYIVLPVPFSDGQINAIALATRAPGGFTPPMLDALRHAVRVLAPLLEAQSLRTLSRVLVETYLGSSSGERVLQGAITRGSGETVRAVVWFCDMRDFTSLSESLPRGELIGLLNEYFGATTAAVEAHGGEVLKFIGDALLAIFPLATGCDVAATGGRALLAAQAARTAIRDANARRREAGAPEIRFGLALHVGDVLHGNIGGINRLDFTVIGPAVNLVTRLESLTKLTGRTLLLSQDFVAATPGRFERVGEFALKGIGTAQPVYAPAEP